MSPDWEIGKLYNQAWSIIKKHKVLWIFGLATAGGISFNFNLPGNFDSDSIKEIQQNFQSLPEDIVSSGFIQVLGASTSKPMEIFSYLFSAVPAYFYIILVVELIVIVLSFVVIGIISKAWSTASLLEGIQTSLSNGAPSIRDSSEKAFSHIKSLAWLQVIPPLVLGLGFIIVIIVILLLIFIPILIVKISLGILSLMASGAILYGVIYYIFSEIWATRIIVLEKKSGKESLLKGYKIAKKKTWAMTLLGLVNIILSFFIMAIPILLIIGIIFAGIFTTDKNEALGVGLFAIGAILFIPMVIAMTLIGGILNAFKATIWSIAYNNIRGKYDGK